MPISHLKYIKRAECIEKDKLRYKVYKNPQHKIYWVDRIQIRRQYILFCRQLAFRSYLGILSHNTVT